MWASGFSKGLKHKGRYLRWFPGNGLFPAPSVRNRFRATEHREHWWASWEQECCPCFTQWKKPQASGLVCISDFPSAWTLAVFRITSLTFEMHKTLRSLETKWGSICTNLKKRGSWSAEEECAAAPLPVPQQSMVLQLAALRGEQWKAVLRETERTVPFPLPAKSWEKYCLVPQPSADCSSNVFSLHLCDRHTYERGQVHCAVQVPVAVSRQAGKGSAANVHLCSQSLVLPSPFSMHNPPVAPCFAVSVVCIALRFRCGAVLLPDTLN